MGRGYRRLLVVGALVPLAILLAPGSCAACSCVTDDPRQHFANADAVFRGLVVGTEEPSWWEDWLPRLGGEPPESRARLRVDETWKGSVPSEAEVSTGLGTCATTFTEGVEYVVFAGEPDDGALVTSVCHGTISTDHTVEVEALLSVLGPATPTAE
ncbi:MAG: hypothetical protein M3Q10_14885 [Chloroflexota bacterium]|nr:hypothetical protein [Chloroflexota bacterium]